MSLYKSFYFLRKKRFFSSWPRIVSMHVCGTELCRWHKQQTMSTHFIQFFHWNPLVRFRVVSFDIVNCIRCKIVSASCNQWILEHTACDMLPWYVHGGNLRNESNNNSCTMDGSDSVDTHQTPLFGIEIIPFHGIRLAVFHQHRTADDVNGIVEYGDTRIRAWLDHWRSQCPCIIRGMKVFNRSQASVAILTANCVNQIICHDHGEQSACLSHTSLRRPTTSFHIESETEDKSWVVDSNSNSRSHTFQPNSNGRPRSCHRQRRGSYCAQRTHVHIGVSSSAATIRLSGLPNRPEWPTGIWGNGV